MWAAALKKFGTSFDALQEKILDFLAENSFDKIILTRFEDWKACPSEGYYPELLEMVSCVHDYAYGWEKNQLEENPELFCEGGSHSEAVLLADWMRPLKRDAVTIAGAFDNECIEDLEIALRFLGVEFQREESLIVG
jgi:hypothetical protein